MITQYKEWDDNDKDKHLKQLESRYLAMPMAAQADVMRGILKPTDFYVYAVLLDIQGQNENLWHGFNKLMLLTGYKKSQLSSILKKLEACGYIERVKKFKNSSATYCLVRFEDGKLVRGKKRKEAKTKSEQQVDVPKFTPTESAEIIECKKSSIPLETERVLTNKNTRVIEDRILPVSQSFNSNGHADSINETSTSNYILPRHVEVSKGKPLYVHPDNKIFFEFNNKWRHIPIDSAKSYLEFLFEYETPINELTSYKSSPYGLAIDCNYFSLTKDVVKKFFDAFKDDNCLNDGRFKIE